jgi:hypothetical protein
VISLVQRVKPVTVSQLIIAGWTGRDREAVEKHIAELVDLGVARPPSTPCFYPVAASLLTTEDAIEVVGTHSSGEVEYFLLAHDGRLWVGVGSDHTDRKLEAHDVTLSKQACAKPIASTVWAMDEVREHWDALILRSYASDGSSRQLYQEGTLSQMLAPASLIDKYADKVGLAPGTLMFCGTFAVIGEVRGAARFEMEIEDPVLGRKIAHGYNVATLPHDG